jgi:nitroreductase
MTTALTTTPPLAESEAFEDLERYRVLHEVLHRRCTARRFRPGNVPREHYEMILDAARLAPSGANAQPWHFIVVTSPWTRRVLADYLCDEERVRKHRGKAAPIDYRAVETAPGCIIVVADFRTTWAYPGLMDGTELDQKLHAQAERIILQSVAASTAAAHLAATALGYQSWWISLIGKTTTTSALHPVLGVPEDLAMTDLLLFGASATPPKRRWKKTLAEVASWDQFDMANFRTVEQIDAWLRDVARPGAPRPAIDSKTEPAAKPGGPLMLTESMIASRPTGRRK